MRTFVFPVAMAAVVVACGSFGEDSSSDSAPDSGTLADGDATRLPSEAGVAPADAPPTLSNDSGVDAARIGVETNPCSGAPLFCSDFDEATVDTRLQQNDGFAASVSVLPKPGPGHDGSGTVKIALADDASKVGELYFLLPKQKALFEIVFRTTAKNGFDVAGVAIPTFESGITLTRGVGSALDLWNYSNAGGSNLGRVADITVDGSTWTYAAIEVDPADTKASFRASAGPVGQPNLASAAQTTVTADFSSGVNYRFGPYRNLNTIMGGSFAGAAMIEVDWVRVTAR